jgi:hypothetical protein
MRVVFGQDPEGTTTRLHFDLMPLTLAKQPATLSPSRWATGTLGALSAAIAAVALNRRRAKSR